MKTPTLAVAVAGVALLAPAAGALAAEHARPQPRVVVADGAAGAVRVLDLASGRRLGRFGVAGPASLTVTDDGRHVLAAQSAQNRVDAIDGGAFTEPHGDHVHHHTQAPRLLPFALTVPKPVHVVPHGDEVAVFADGSGDAQVFPTAALKRRAAAVATARTGTPHHGVAVPHGDRVVISVADPASEDGALPATVQVRDRAGATLASADCRDLHGEASSASWAAFACADGIALIRPAGTPSHERIPYPARTNAEQRAFTLHTDAAGRRLVGNFGPRSLVVAHVASKTSRVVPVAARIASFGVDARSGAIVVLSTDGRLRRIDPANGRQTAVRRVVSRSFRPAWDRPSPKLTVRGGLAAISDPARTRVTVVRTGDLRPVQTLTVPGRPTSVALVGAG
ncbi:YncE family protein [Conexibacter woesei]|uniref:Uncharacterized protein n=1 Tax=Conexibacter woesei (strain DSM 14684 / CCUG 47730 / CIP 108061 / JCM 11494 / NBRC 100937 / ID131577) TaxID=469383 RepID=D3F6N5_CONWI|nr:hypothetical protein [Conexibacter woesei]ADB50802.1 conserved hypothetical protein [Conexibacter woesei DSM 14684]